MNRNGFVLTAVAGAALFCAMPMAARADTAALAEEAKTYVTKAEAAVSDARAAIENGKSALVRIPEDSPLMEDVKQMLESAAENWAVAVESLKGASESAAKVGTASSEAIAKDYALLAKVNAGVAVSGSRVVQISLRYVEAVADNKTESLDIIRASMQDATAAASQVQFNYERVKTLIAEKYSK